MPTSVSAFVRYTAIYRSLDMMLKDGAARRYKSRSVKRICLPGLSSRGRRGRYRHLQAREEARAHVGTADQQNDAPRGIKCLFRRREKPSGGG